MKKTEVQFCQSCGMPLDYAHLEYIGKEADGSRSIYCNYCYKNSAFVNPDITLEEMIEFGVPHLAQKIGEEAAREQLTAFLPTLARWKAG